MKKFLEKLIDLFRDIKLLSDGVGIWLDLFKFKFYVIYMVCKSLVIISIVIEVKCWFVYI